RRDILKPARGFFTPSPSPRGRGEGRLADWLALAKVAIEAQAPETGSEHDVGLAVAVMVDPGGGRDCLVTSFARQQRAVVAKSSIAEIGVESQASWGCQEQIGLAVPVVVGPHRRSASAVQPGDLRLQEGIAEVAQQFHPTGAKQGQVRL